MIIDLSKFNTVKNWDAVAPQVEVVIIRCGYRGYGSAGNIVIDPKFESHIANCVARNIPVSLYFMSQAINNVEAVEEADFCIEQAKRFGVKLPIFFDSEWSHAIHTGRADKLTKAQRTSVCKAFCERIRAYGYTAGVYANKDWFMNHLDVNQLLDYVIWYAQYNSTCTANHRIDLWQYTSNGSVEGISGRVDLSTLQNAQVFKGVIVAKPQTTKSNPYREPTVIIKKGSRGDGAKWVQWYLKEKGYYSGQIDGIFGQLSDSALRNFQIDSKLVVDGLCGKNTRAALKV